MAWKPEKPETLGDVIQKSVVRSHDLVTNVIAEERYTLHRLIFFVPIQPDELYMLRPVHAGGNFFFKYKLKRGV